jgi:hypothetical protein
MPNHFWNLFWRSVAYFPAIFSGNWFTVGALPILAFIYKERARIGQIGWRTMTWQQWRRIAKDAWILAVFYVAVFGWAVVHTVYQDHIDLVARIAVWKEKAESQEVYVETSLEPKYLSSLPPDPNSRPSWFVELEPIDVHFIWTRTGESVAEDVFPYAMVYLEPNFSHSTQREVVSRFQDAFTRELKAKRDQQVEGPTLGFSDAGKSVWATAREPGPILTRKLEEELWDGTQIVFLVSAVSYKTTSGQRYIGQFCNFLQPLNQNSTLSPDKPMPIPMPQVALSFHNCDLYLSTVKE